MAVVAVAMVVVGTGPGRKRMLLHWQQLHLLGLRVPQLSSECVVSVADT